MVIPSTLNYTMQTHTPILNAKLGKALCKAYAFEPDMVITFDIRPEDDIEGNRDIWVDVQTPPVLPLCEFLNHMYVFDMRLFEPVE